MSTPSEEPIVSPPVTAQTVTDWLVMMNRKRFPLYAHIKNGQVPEDTFWTMATLLQDAMEEVRVMSTTLREDSTTLREDSTTLRARTKALQERSAQILARSATLAKHVPVSLWERPSSQEIQEAESQLLEIFKHGLMKPLA